METVSFTADELEHLKQKIRKAASIATMMENDLESERMPLTLIFFDM